MRPSRSVVLVGFLLGCATAGPPGAHSSGYFSTTASGSAAVGNVTYFDLASCFPSPPLVTDLYDDEQLLAALTSTRAAVLECAVDPAHRGARKETHITLSAIARPGEGVQASVGGENLTDSGQVCVLGAIQGALAALPPLPEGWPPVAAQVDFVHSVETLPAVVQPSLNDHSEATGRIRLAMPTFCSCLEPWRDAPPKELELTLSLKRPPGTLASRTEQLLGWIHPSRVRAPANLGPTEAPVAACLQQKLEAMEFRVPRVDVEVPFYFQFIDSRRGGPLPGLPPWLQHKQLEAVRNRRFAEMAIALGVRSSAARNYDALVKRYQGDRSVKVKALAQACTGLLEADDAWESAVQRKLEAERIALRTASDLGPPGPLVLFNREHRAVAERLAETERSLATVAQVRQVDERACPRVHKGPLPRGARRDAPPEQATPFSP